MRTARIVLLIAMGSLLLWLANEQILYYRDNFSTHYPVQSATSNLLRDGLPLWNPLVGGGQPLAGNPNNLTFYPTTLLYTVLPAHLAFNLHFLLHLAIAWLGMKRLLSEHGVNRGDSSGVAWLYLLSGTTISCLIFYNLIVAAALMPWALFSLEKLLRTRRMSDAVCLGSVCGMMGLAAEPAVIGGFTIVAIAIFISRFSMRAVAPLIIATLVAMVVASPQLLAYFEISGETERAHFPYSTGTTLAASLGPARLAEIVTGPVHGSVLDHSPNGYWANRVDASWPPFFMSVMLSALFVPALLRRGGRRLLPYQLMIPLLLFIAAGSYNPVVETLMESFESLRIIRYPEKLALIVTVLACVLIGVLFRDLEVRRFRAATLLTIAGTTVIVVAVMATRSLPTLSNVRLVAISLLQIVAIAPLLIHPRFTPPSRTLALLALIPLAFWAIKIVPLDDADYYTESSPLAESVGNGVIEVSSVTPSFTQMSPRHLYRFYAFRLNPVFAAGYGIPYALSSSPEGMHSYLSRLAVERYRALDPARAVRYLRINGASFTVRSSPVEAPGVTLVNEWKGWTDPVLLYQINQSRPFLWEPAFVRRAAHATEAVGIIERDGFDPLQTTVVPSWVTEPAVRAGSSKIELMSRDSQRLSFRVQSSEKTIIVVNQSWFSAWHATAGDTELMTFPADIDRLGIIVPEGRTVVDLEFGRHRLAITWALVASVAMLLYALGAAIVSSRRIAEPAR
ncbi:MAG: hypothetical protein KY432_01700 [Acidobacteria bacterium]|nr:hypothetical protein [Acidobacteriota bacterium]